ncbi:MULTISPECIES: hypothetical protein [unclassified Sphingobium]|uniref:hypothetical protein n=1 Tax=unclassified Sphingobium TaxID=2611147 RepID=UPI0007701BF5|nr:MULTISPECIES: hypothetical protein [unclassified Sphingobium]AMK23876.1 hypothetical protein K426_14720 [Sphingobium sp. TKS]NML89350.1 hypothetical protein [Sphingobium sp. TB-6]
MSDLDQLLGHVRALPADPRLETMEAAVMAGLASRRERAVARRSLALAGIVAIGIGGVGSVVPGSSAQAASRPVIIGMSDYAPSRLLGQ